MMQFTRNLLLFLVAMASFLSHTILQADDHIKEELSKKFSSIDPKMVVTDVADTPVPSVVEVEINGREYLYSTEDGNYIFHGKLIRVNNDGFSNMTEERLEQNRESLIGTLDLSKAITFRASGTKEGEDEIYVFTDVSCGYCRNFHTHMDEINQAGITVHYLAYPRAGTDSIAGKLMREVWCSADPRSAITKALTDPMPGATVTNVPAPEPGPCTGPIQEHQRLAADFAVHGTPAIYDTHGRRLGGYLEPEQLIEALREK